MKKKKILSYYEQLNDGLEEEDIYEQDSIDELEESDEIDSAEAGFMRGYIEDDEEWLKVKRLGFIGVFISLLFLK